jgi:CRISPR/Cas system Type II protein with McrA/HNH and RuvC-like nuclease domain
LDLPTLRAFGVFTLPRVLWDAFSLHACWIEPALLQAWVKQMQDYEEQREPKRELSEYYDALRWLVLKHDTEKVRKFIKSLLQQGQAIYCLWSGKRIDQVKGFAVDHCFPFAYWPNNDLWNLFPTRVEVNQKKSDRLPSASLLASSQERIVEWWQSAYSQGLEKQRFFQEAQSALPLLHHKQADLSAVFDALQLQRLRLRQHQQLAEWVGP